MQSHYERLKSLVLSVEPDVIKSMAGHKAAGTRVRKVMQEIKNLAQDIRVDVIERRDATDAKPGTDVKPVPEAKPAPAPHEDPQNKSA